MNFKDKEVLITGGTGTLGSNLVKMLLSLKDKPKGIRILSRDEYKQWKLRKDLGDPDNVSWLIGDVRNDKRLQRAFKGVDYVIHTAAMKQIGSCEENPIEAIETNVGGSENVINACIDNKVDKCILISTDKAVDPINHYGATKMLAEKLFLNAKQYGGGSSTDFMICRYGNVLGSRGSVIELFKEQRKTGTITITHKDMTRFWIKIEEVCEFILNRIIMGFDGHIYIPLMDSSTIMSIANIIAPNREIKYIGLRKGEKLHECLVASHEGERTELYGHHIDILPKSSQVNMRIRLIDGYYSNSDLIDIKELEEKYEEELVNG